MTRALAHDASGFWDGVAALLGIDHPIRVSTNKPIADYPIDSVWRPACLPWRDCVVPVTMPRSRDLCRSLPLPPHQGEEHLLRRPDLAWYQTITGNG
jgi:hypothetical protein